MTSTTVTTPANLPAELATSPPKHRPQASKADAELTNEVMHRTYTGLLDDVLVRYSDDYMKDDFFNKMIAKNIFFGGGIYLNDGYLVNHPTARAYLNNENSLLRLMIDTNFIRILTRTSSSEELARLPQIMADSGNASFARLVASAEWQDFRPLLLRISRNAFFNGNPRQWPDFNMSISYKKLIDRIHNARPEELGMSLVTEDELKWVYENFVLLEPGAGNPRHKLEVAAWSVLELGQESRPGALAEIMNIANQAYHYNFGLTLTAEDEFEVAVDTTVGYAFDELLNTREIETGQLDGIPILRLPKDLPFDNGELFLPFIRRGTKVSDAKAEYMQRLRSLITASDRSFDDLKKDVREASELYVNRIVEHLAPEFGRVRLEQAFDESISVATGIIKPGSPASTIAIAAPYAGLAITIQERYRLEGRQFLAERFRLKDVTDSYDPSRETLLRLKDLKPHMTSLAFNEDAARDHIADIPRMSTSR